MGQGKYTYPGGGASGTNVPIAALPSSGTSGVPTAGTWITGNEVYDSTFRVWVCTAGGTPGTWSLVSSGGGAFVPLSLSTAGAPTTGTWSTGQSFVDSNGIIWNCTAGGTPGTWVQSSGTGTTAPVIRATSGAPVVVVGDQLGDFAYDSTANILYGPLGGTIGALGTLWTTSPATCPVNRLQGALAAPVIFTSGGTWTPSTTGQALFAALVVGGGGGGGAGASGFGGGAGSGGEVLESFYLGHVTTAQTVTIGAGGAHGATSGSAGGNTSIGALVTALGGQGCAFDQFSTAGSLPNAFGLGGGGSTSGAGSGGLANISRFGNGGGGGGFTNAAGGMAGGNTTSAGGAGVTGAGGGGAAPGAAGTAGSGTTGGTGGTAPANTGGGGGGGGAGTTGGSGGSGGSGYVIIYQVA